MAPKPKAAKAPKILYDYSGLEKDMRVQAEVEGVYYAAEILTVSKAKNRAKAPVKVHFCGYTAEYDEWVDGSRLRSKALKKETSKPNEEKAASMKKRLVRSKTSDQLPYEDVLQMKKVFEVVDFNKSGTIDAVELRTLFKMLGEPITEEEASEVIESISGGKKAKEIDFTGFLEWWVTTHDTTRGRRWAERFKVVTHAATKPDVFKIATESEGKEGTVEWRMFFKDTNTGKRISPWTDVPLTNDDGTFNFICEIPKWTRAKNEIATNEPFNPIKQDTKNGRLRDYLWGDMLFNYGALPQTWEDPNHVDADTGAKGDNDPIDVIEIGTRQRPVGSITPVKVLGILAMIDSGETDWKVITIATDDPLASKLDSMHDVEAHMPNLASVVHAWLRDYKTIDFLKAGDLGDKVADKYKGCDMLVLNPKKLNEFAFDGKYKDVDYAKSKILETSEFFNKKKAAAMTV